MAHSFDGWLLVHAGVVPQWDTPTTLALAGEIEAPLRGPELPQLLQGMYGNEPAQWSDALQGPPRWRFIINVLTRIRFTDAKGRLELKTQGPSAPAARPKVTCPGSRCRAGGPRACRSPSATGRRSG